MQQNTELMRPLRNLLHLIAGVIFLAAPFMPVSTWAGDPAELRYGMKPTTWLSGIFILFALSWIISFLPKLDSLFGALLSRLLKAPLLGFETVAVLWLASVITAVNFFTFNGRPHLVDTIVQLMQAKIFLTGEPSVPSPPLIGFFQMQNMLFDSGRWYGQYAPGHPLILAMGYLIYSPLVPCVVLSISSMLLISRFTRSAYSQATAKISVVMFMTCSFFVFMSASYMNHISALFFASLALYSFSRWLDGGHRVGGAALLGLALGCGFTTRSLDFIAIGAAFVLVSLPSSLDKYNRFVPSACVGAVTLASACLPYFLFNKATTGEFFLPGFIKLWGSGHSLGFHPTPWGQTHTLLDGLLNQVIDLNILNEYLFEACIPALMPLAASLLIVRSPRTWDSRLLVCFFSVPTAYVFYWHRDSYLGPRYIYVCLTFLIPLLSQALLSCWKWSEHRSFGLASILMPVKAQTMLAVAITLSCSFSLFSGFPMRERHYRGRLNSMKIDVKKLAGKAGIQNGIIFIPVSWGARIISNLRELGASASVIETSYQRVDHCELQSLCLDPTLNAKTPQSAALLEKTLVNLIDQHQQVQKMNINGDPTLRLIPGSRLTQTCKEELDYDKLGYTIFEPHLLSNSPLIKNEPLVFARDLHTRNEELFRSLPGRLGFIFRGDHFEVVK